MNYSDKGLPFDTEYFKKLRENGLKYDVKETFEKIYKSNHWNGNYSVSGEGSDLLQTQIISLELPEIISRYPIRTFIDAPCGDFNWMKDIHLPVNQYIGVDIVKEIIEKNQRNYGSQKYCFLRLDLINDPLPKADLMFCRDCLVHLSFSDIKQVFQNISKSNISYIFLTTFTERTVNEDITTGDWRPLNFEIEPFCLPKPLEIINENCTEGDGSFSDKSLGLWKTEDLNL